MAGIEIVTDGVHWLGQCAAGRASMSCSQLAARASTVGSEASAFISRTCTRSTWMEGVEAHAIQSVSGGDVLT